MALLDWKIKFFADYIQSQIGIVYLPQNYFQLERRLEEVCKVLQIGSTEELYTRASTRVWPELKSVLLDIATNNETSFFRDAKVFKAIQEKIVPALLSSQPPPAMLRLWSAACSFGQEPYSLSMLLTEMSRHSVMIPPFEIQATDFAEHALRRSKEASYTQIEIQRGLSAAQVVGYFNKDEQSGEWKLKPDISRRVRFDRLNLLDSFSGYANYDLILCRYVLIYQDNAKKKEIMSKLARCLRPRGFLILGASESMLGLSDEFEQLSHDGAIFYRRKT